MGPQDLCLRFIKISYGLWTTTINIGGEVPSHKRQRFTLRTQIHLLYDRLQTKVIMFVLLYVSTEVHPDYKAHGYKAIPLLWPILWQS